MLSQKQGAQKYEDAMLLALNMEEEDHKSKELSGPWRLVKARTWILP